MFLSLLDRRPSCYHCNCDLKKFKKRVCLECGLRDVVLWQKTLFLLSIRLNISRKQLTANLLRRCNVLQKFDFSLVSKEMEVENFEKFPLW